MFLFSVMMRAATYDKNSAEGVFFRDVPIPTLAAAAYDHATTAGWFRRLAFVGITVFMFCMGLLFRVLRCCLWFIPPSYGSNPTRQFVLCRVNYGGVNPVDAKFLYVTFSHPRLAHYLSFYCWYFVCLSICIYFYINLSTHLYLTTVCLSLLRERHICSIISTCAMLSTIISLPICLT